MNYNPTRIINFLRDVYGATNVRVTSGGKHSKLEWIYCNKRFVISMAKTPTNADATFFGQQRQIRALLGTPSTTPKTPRKLEDMMPILPALSTASQISQNVSTQNDFSIRGYGALYCNANKYQYEFYIPLEIFKRYDSPATINTSFVQCDEKQLVFKIEKAPIDARYKTKVRTQKDTAFVSGMFTPLRELGTYSKTPCTFTIEHNAIIARINIADCVPVHKYRKAIPNILATSPAVLISPQNPQNPIESIMPPVIAPIRKENAIIPTDNEIKDVLRRIALIERNTNYKLVKIRETGKWRFTAPFIEAEDES